MATPKFYDGREFTIIADSSNGGMVVGYATDFTLTINKKTVDVTTLASAGWTDKMVTDKDWSFDVTGLVSRTSGDASVGYNYLMNQILTNDASVQIGAKPIQTGNTYFTGGAFLTNVKESGGVGKPVTYSFTAEGTGPLSSATS
jgi:predicted secreted protein